MNETTERFFQEIATHVGYHRVVEVHLFPVIRQSGVEAAVAVVAAEPEAAPQAASDVAADDTGEIVAEAIPDDVPEPVSDDASALAQEDTSPDANDEEQDATRGSTPDDVAESVSAAERPRLVVYTARYRHTVKGTARGKWVVDVVAEADAPLVTVDAVVRGVAQRSGEEFQPERISGEQFRAIVPAPVVPEPGPA